MKICAVSQSFYPHAGGVSYYLLWLGRRCHELGHELSVVHLRPVKAPIEETMEGIKVYRTPKETPDAVIIQGYTKFKEMVLQVFHGIEPSEEKLLNRHLYGFNEYFTINKLFADRIREIYELERFDLLHVHDFQVLLQGSMLKDLKVPKIFTWHIPFTEKVPKRWRDFIIQYMQEYDNVVLSTRPYVATAIRSGLSWDKVVCIAPFIVVGKPRANKFRENYGISPNDKMILCVARIDPLKGQDRLIQALPSVLEKIPDAKCVLVGDGSMTKEVLKADEKRQYELRLRSLVSDLKLARYVTFAGHISRGDLMQAYEACDVVVLPSLMEGFGLAITEGMAFGKPVIGSATGGIMMQIWPGTNGYLVEPSNVKQLSEALIKVLSNGHLKSELGKRAKEIYEKYYSLERGVRDNIELYERILSR